MRYLVFLIFTLLISASSRAQDSLAVSSVPDKVELKKDSVLVPKDTVSPRSKFQPDAKRAALLSALIPGTGQLYNRQYWKAPIVYGVMGTTIYFAIIRHQEYQRYRKAYVSRLANEANSKDEFQGILSLPAIKQYQDEAKQNMDMMVVYTVIAYAGQILEAISGAHLRNFDISKNLALEVHPIISPNLSPGIGLVVNFKR